MKTRILILLGAIEHFANQAASVAEALFLPNAFAPAADNWVQLSPFGDFGNIDAAKKRVIQRFRKEDAEAICNEFNSLGRKITQPLGMPFYVGHPDHPRFKGQPGHSDTSSKGRGREMQVRHDAQCAKCADFANSGVPCADHGLFVKMHWSPEGEQLIANEAFHGHSVNWAAVPDGTEKGARIMRPVRVKSAGFTNEPGIPVTPATLANELGETEDVANEVVHPGLKSLAGFKPDEEVTIEQVIEALKKLHAAKPLANEDAALATDALLATIFLANDADGDIDTVPPWVHEALGTDPAAGKEAVKAALADKVAKAGHMDRVKKTGDEMRKASDRHYKARADMEQALCNEKEARTKAETAFANERKARAEEVVAHLVKAGKIVTADRAARIEELANAGEAFATKAAEFANGQVVVKVAAKSAELAGKHAVLSADLRARQAAFEGLMAARAEEFPNEDYQARYEAVANSPKGQQLFAQMQRPAADDAKD